MWAPRDGLRAPQRVPAGPGGLFALRCGLPACGTAVSTGLRAAPGPPPPRQGDGEGVEGGVPPGSGLPPRLLRSAPCGRRGAKGTVPPATPTTTTTPGSVPRFSPLPARFRRRPRGAASAVRGFGSRGAAVRGRGDAPADLRRGAGRCCAPGSGEGEPSPGSRWSPGGAPGSRWSPGTAAGGCPQLPPPPRPGCSLPGRCGGVRWEKARSRGKRLHVRKMFAVN